MKQSQDPIHVLHVDDDPEFVEMAVRFLESVDDRLCVETVVDVTAGLDRVGEGDIDCVVSDHDMPKKNGIEFLQRVREGHPDLPFILFTGKGSEEVASEAISAGVTDYLQKGTGTECYHLLANRITNAVSQYRAQKRADQAHQQLRRVIDLIPDPIFVKDAEGKFVLVNETFASVYDRTPGELEGQPEHVIESPERVQRFQEIDQEIIDGGTTRKVYEGEFHSNYDGTDHQTYKIPLTIPGQETPGVLGYVRDLSDIKASQRELERQNERLAEFANLVSHDLQNPLKVAQGRLELAREECESPHLDTVEGAHSRMEMLIEDLLALAQDGETALTCEVVSIATAARNSWEFLEPSDGTLVLDTTAQIRADSRRFEQLLEKCLQNAITHGGDDVTITIGDLEDGFYVADDGDGLATAGDTVFQTGYTTAVDGTGYGLSVVGQIADAHGWDVSVTDSSDGGAQFEIRDVDIVE